MKSAARIAFQGHVKDATALKA